MDATTLTRNAPPRPPAPPAGPGAPRSGQRHARGHGCSLREGRGCGDGLSGAAGEMHRSPRGREGAAPIFRPSQGALRSRWAPLAGRGPPRPSTIAASHLPGGACWLAEGAKLAASMLRCGQSEGAESRGSAAASTRHQRSSAAAARARGRCKAARAHRNGAATAAPGPASRQGGEGWRPTKGCGSAASQARPAARSPCGWPRRRPRQRGRPRSTWS